MVLNDEAQVQPRNRLRSVVYVWTVYCVLMILACSLKQKSDFPFLLSFSAYVEILLMMFLEV